MTEQARIRLCVAMPIANEAGTIQALLGDVLARLTADDRVLLIVDNVSTDETRDIVRGFVSERGTQQVELIEAPENRCVVDAYVRGYREALKRQPRWILEMDAGYSHDPADIPRFIEAMEQGYDYVGSSRFMPGAQFEAGAYRRLLSQGGSWLSRLLLGCPLTDMTSGFQCFTPDCLSYVLDKGIFSRGGFFQTEIRYWVSRFNWKEIPIRYGNTRQSVPFAYVTDSLSGLLKLTRIARFSAGANAS